MRGAQGVDWLQWPMEAVMRVLPCLRRIAVVVFAFALVFALSGAQPAEAQHRGGYGGYGGRGGYGWHGGYGYGWRGGYGWNGGYGWGGGPGVYFGFPPIYVPPPVYYPPAYYPPPYYPPAYYYYAPPVYAPPGGG